MQFGSSPVGEAAGGILVHSIRTGGISFKKGRVLSVADAEALVRAGFSDVVIARFEPGDVGEDEAAARVAAALAGTGVRIGAAFTGRANLYATTNGMALVDRNAIDAINAIDESITVATLAPSTRVTDRQILATVKIIPFAVARRSLERVLAIVSDAKLGVAPFQPRRAALISTLLPGTKPSVIEKSRSVLDGRLRTLGSTIVFDRTVPHDEAALAALLLDADNSGADPILILGASAITDRRDVIPAAIARAGGRIAYFGMPVDPGNLLLLGELKGKAVIGLPSCARSPKLNGVDFVLWRIAAGLPTTGRDIAAMGAGGLLTEIPSRPQPRDEQPKDQGREPRIGAIVLAAGMASRMGGRKLLADLGGKPLIRHAVEAAVHSAAKPVLVVTGNAGDEVSAAIAGLSATIVRNPDFAMGLSTSLKSGLRALPPECDGAIILLADMPGVTARLIDRLIAAFNPPEDRAICVATRGGKRGNPVLWSRRFFPEMLALEGDTGAKHLLVQHGESVCEVEAADDGPLVDIDTEEALKAYRAR